MQTTHNNVPFLLLNGTFFPTTAEEIKTVVDTLQLSPEEMASTSVDILLRTELDENEPVKLGWEAEVLVQVDRRREEWQINLLTAKEDGLIEDHYIDFIVEDKLKNGARLGFTPSFYPTGFSSSEELVTALQAVGFKTFVSA